MKMNRFVALFLAVMLMLSATAFASSLQWDFSTGSSNTGFGNSSTNSGNNGANSQSSEYVSNDYVLISGGDCHVRSMPNLSGTSYGVLREGQTAHCLGGQSTDNRGVLWYEIDFNGMSGWVSSKYALLNGVGAVTYANITGGDCNMRNNPNLSGKVLKVLKEGASAIYQGQTSTDNRGVDWYYVNYNGTYGWVSSKYTVLSSTPSSSTSTSSGYVKATSHKVNLRDVPNLNGQDIGTMDKNETATYLGEKSTDSRGVVWYKVRFQGEVGWVSSRYSKLYN